VGILYCTLKGLDTNNSLQQLPFSGEQNTNMKIKPILLIAVALVLTSLAFAQAPTAPAPLTEKEVVKELKSQGPDQLIKEVGERGVDFDMTPEIEKTLRKAKATDAVVQAVSGAGPKARANAKAAGAAGAGGLTLTPDEGKDFAAVRNELDPDRTITLAEDFAKKYPNSPALSYVFSLEANAYQQKGDAAKVVDLCEKSLTLKKDNLMTLIMISTMIPQPQYLSKRTDAEKQLTLAEGYAQDALKLIAALPKQANESEADEAKRKNEYAATIESGLGMVHLQRAQLGLTGIDKDELVKAEQDYNKAITSSDHPDMRDYYRLGETYKMDGKVDQAIEAFTKASQLGQGTAIKQYADQQIEALKKAKTQATTPAKP
jgi:tetratricopeptide (TPR) repeat protein